MNSHSDFARISFFYQHLQHHKNKKNWIHSFLTLIELARRDVPIVKYEAIFNIMVLCQKKAQPQNEATDFLWEKMAEKCHTDIITLGGEMVECIDRNTHFENDIPEGVEIPLDGMEGCHYHDHNLQSGCLVMDKEALKLPRV